jgi:hypothetical protein
MLRIISLTISAGLMLGALALAHDPSQHKGKPVAGEVVSVSKERFDMKTSKGTVPVTFSSKTKFEHGTATVDSSHVKTGEKVQVFGTRLPSGVLVAKEVLIGAPAKTPSDSHSGHAPAKKK